MILQLNLIIIIANHFVTVDRHNYNYFNLSTRNLDNLDMKMSINSQLSTIQYVKNVVKHALDQVPKVSLPS